MAWLPDYQNELSGACITRAVQAASVDALIMCGSCTKEYHWFVRTVCWARELTIAD
jgi:hypothetical protein